MSDKSRNESRTIHMKKSVRTYTHTHIHTVSIYLPDFTGFSRACRLSRIVVAPLLASVGVIPSDVSQLMTAESHGVSVFVAVVRLRFIAAAPLPSGRCLLGSNCRSRQLLGSRSSSSSSVYSRSHLVVVRVVPCRETAIHYHHRIHFNFPILQCRQKNTVRLCDWAIWKRILFSVRPDNLFPRWQKNPIYRKSRNE